MMELLSKIWPGPGVSPTRKSSSPVETIATCGKPPTSICAIPCEASSARVCADIGSAARKNFLSFHKVRSFSPDELARLHAALQHDRFAFGRHVLLHDDRVGSRRQRRTGKNANRLSRSDRQAAIRPGRLFADDAQTGSRLTEAACTA